MYQIIKIFCIYCIITIDCDRSIQTDQFINNILMVKLVEVNLVYLLCLQLIVAPSRENNEGEKKGLLHKSL